MTAKSRTKAKADSRLGTYIVQENLVTCFEPGIADACFSAMSILDVCSFAAW